MLNWVVVEVQHLHEQRVSQGLLRKSIHNIVPSYSREIRHARRVEVRRFPLFPRYIFAHVDLDDHKWKAVYAVRGVRSILGMPTPIDDDVVQALGGCNIDLKRGDKVRFLGGPYEGIEAVFKCQKDQQLLLEITFMGHEVEIRALRGEVIKS